MTLKAKTLEAVLEEAERRPRFVMARLDGAALRKAWPAWTDRRVQGQINGFAFRTRCCLQSRVRNLFW
jgi:hypothetical protein